MIIFEPLLGEFTNVQIDFCAGLLAMRPEEFRCAKEDDLNKLYDMLCDIESGVDYRPGATLTQVEKMATELVDLMGNAIAEELGETLSEEEWKNSMNANMEKYPLN